MSSDPLLHIKGTPFYLEVPRGFWQYDNKIQKQVPRLWEQHKHPPGKTWKQQLDGKIIIPQPFGAEESLRIGQRSCIEVHGARAFIAVFIAAVFICRPQN
jgi:hypothetical protein